MRHDEIAQLPSRVTACPKHAYRNFMH
jgi:hypothetical protein